MMMRVRSSGVFAMAIVLTLAACVVTESPAAPPSALPEVWEGYTSEAGRAHIGKRLAEIAAMPEPDQAVLFVGDSITEGADLARLFPGVTTSNHGIGWDQTHGVLIRMEQVTRGNPEKIFLLIGTNDLSQPDSEPRVIAQRVGLILDALSEREPEAALHVIGVLPREAEYASAVDQLNAGIQREAEDAEAIYLDLSDAFTGEKRALRADLTYDGLHLNATGYQRLGDAIRICVERGCPEGL